jgi:hypothetical protein
MTDPMTDGPGPIPPRPRRDFMRDGIVVLSMTFVALAVGFGLHLQFGLSNWSAAAAAVTLYAAMLFSHLILTQSRETAMLRRELGRVTAEMAQMRRPPAEGGTLREAPGTGSSAGANAYNQPYGYARHQQPEVTVPLPAVAGPDTVERPQQSTGHSTTSRPIDVRVTLTHVRDEPHVRVAPATVPADAPRSGAKLRPKLDDGADLLTDLGGMSQTAAAPIRPRPAANPATPAVDHFAAPLRGQPAIPPAKPAAPKPVAQTPARAASVATPRTTSKDGDRDVEAIHDLIKKLAADIVGGQTASQSAEPTSTSAPLAANRTANANLAPSLAGGVASDARIAAAVRVKANLITDELAAALAADDAPQAAPPAPPVPVAATPVVTKAVSTVTVAAEPQQQVPVVVSVPTPITVVVEPMPVVKAVVNASATPVLGSATVASQQPPEVTQAQAMAQSLAEHLDALPPAGTPTQLAAKSVAAPQSVSVSSTAVAAARSAVEAQLAKVAVTIPREAVVGAALVAQVSRPSPTPSPVAGRAQPSPVVNELADIGAQLTADLGAEATSEAEPTFDQSVQALKTAVDAMRTRPTQPQLMATEPPVVGSAASSDPVVQARLARISQAIEDERYDVCLEAIIGLGSRRAQHYEVTIRLKDSDGVLEEDVRETARGSGLLPLLDAAIVDQSARVAWKLEDRGKPGSLFSQITGESLENDRFLNQFARLYVGPLGDLAGYGRSWVPLQPGGRDRPRPRF